MRFLLAAVLVPALLVAGGSALAQQRDREQHPGAFKGGGPARMTGGGERRGAEPPRQIEPQRGDARRPERMSPQDRERLRRDIDDANRRMEPRGGRR